MTSIPSTHQGLNWLRDHSPLFKKMVAETEERKRSEEQYKLLKPPARE